MTISRELKRHGCYVVSSATLITEIVGKAFLAAIEDVEVRPGRIAFLRDEFDIAIEEGDLEYLDFLVWEEMFDELAYAAPDGFYFGTVEGDGAEFGFFPIDE